MIHLCGPWSGGEFGVATCNPTNSYQAPAAWIELESLPLSHMATSKFTKKWSEPWPWINHQNDPPKCDLQFYYYQSIHSTNNGWSLVHKPSWGPSPRNSVVPLQEVPPGGHCKRRENGCWGKTPRYPRVPLDLHVKKTGKNAAQLKCTKEGSITLFKYNYWYWTLFYRRSIWKFNETFGLRGKNCQHSVRHCFPAVWKAVWF